MNLRNRVINVVAASAVVLGMAGGIASAQLDDQETTQLSVVCEPTASVDLGISGPFSLDMTGGNTTVAPLEDGFTIELNLTCNWETNFQVNAVIGNFWHEDALAVVGSGQAPAFSGAHLELTGGSRQYDGIVSLNPLRLAGPPEYQTTVFAGNTTSDYAVIEDRSFTIPFVNIPVNVASPGITTVTYDGNLNNLPNNLAVGTYEAEMTVELVIP